MLLKTMASLLLLLLLTGRRPLFANLSHTKDYFNTFKVLRARKLRPVLVEQVGVPAQKAKWIAALLNSLYFQNSEGDRPASSRGIG